MSLVPFELLSLCWNPEQASLWASESMRGPLKRKVWDSSSPSPWTQFLLDIMGVPLSSAGSLDCEAQCGSGTPCFSRGTSIAKLYTLILNLHTMGPACLMSSSNKTAFLGIELLFRWFSVMVLKFSCNFDVLVGGDEHGVYSAILTEAPHHFLNDVS